MSDEVAILALEQLARLSTKRGAIFLRAIVAGSSLVLYNEQSPAGAVFTSCYKLNSGAATSSVVTVSGTYTLPASNSDYTFTSDASCNLDEANGETLTNILTPC